MVWSLLFACHGDPDPEASHPTKPEPSGCVPAEEVCNGIDDDCDGDADESGGPPVHLDEDGDGFGAISPTEVCGAQGIDDATDCDDGDDAVFPGAADTWYDGVDSDCGGGSDFDQDGDGEDVLAGGGTDCRDLAPEIGQSRCGNLLVGASGRVLEIRPDGSVFWQSDVVHPQYGNIPVRGVRMGEDGRIYAIAHYGWDDLLFASWDGAWTFVEVPDWDFGSNGSWGEFALSATTAWCPDPTLLGTDPGGVIAIDLATGGATRVIDAVNLAVDNYASVFLGHDGLLYAYDGDLDIYDPTDVAFQRTQLLPADDMRSVAITADGSFFVADWSTNAIIAYTSVGNETGRVDVYAEYGLNGPNSLDLRADGAIALADRFGRLLLTDTSLSSGVVLDAPWVDVTSFVDWVAP